MNTVRRTQRPPKACYACARKKVKCSKTIPCQRCILHGIQDQCTRESVQLTVSTIRRDEEVNFLQDLVYEIETNPQVCMLLIKSRLQQRLLYLESGTVATIPMTGGDDTNDSILDDIEPPMVPISTASSSSTVERDALPLCPSLGPSSVKDSDMSQSATTLEYLAWGRQYKPAHNGLREDIELPHKSSPIIFSDNNISSLPSIEMSKALVKFHIEFLQWHHNALHAPTFVQECENFWSFGKTSDMLWLALYFSVLSSAAWCFPRSQAEALFPKCNLKSLSASWYSAMVSILYRNNYLGQHSIYSCQAIIISTLVGHCLGHSDLNTVLISSAIRIAQCMGLDKQGEEDVKNLPWESKVKYEIVKRVWWQLCIQDYFAVAFANTYTVHPKQYCTPLSTNCNDDTLEEKLMKCQTISSYCISLAKIASLMPEVIDGIYNYKEPIPIEKRYQHIVDMDLKMRELVASLPKFLLRSSSEPALYPWVDWARITLTISAADKIIMIHRSFIIRSFRSPLYAYTRMTCISASLTILREYAKVRDMDVASIWIVPAFTIAAAIILMLDLLHKPASDPGAVAHRQLVQTAVTGLSLDFENRMAVRGAKILEALLKEEVERHVNASSSTSNDQIHTEPTTVESTGFLAGICAHSSEGHLGSKQSSARYSQPSVNYDDLQVWFDESMPCSNNTDAGLLPLSDHRFETAYGVDMF